MTDPFRLLSTYFWLIALAFGAFNYFRADQNVASAALSADQEAEARIYLRRFAIAGALPWVIMGIGQFTGSVPSIWHYFRPQDQNPFVIAWLAVMFLQACLFAWWVLLAGGARKILEYNLMSVLGQSKTKPMSEFGIKLLAALGPLFVLVWVFMASSMNAPLPQ